MFFTKILEYFFPPKKKANPTLSPPDYAGRHEGETFLILATGPSIKTYSKQINDFIEKTKPIVICCNNTPTDFRPKYHAFTNRKRFLSYGHLIHKDATPLLSPYLTSKQIKTILGNKKFEYIQFDNEYPSSSGDLLIDNQNIIRAKGATVATLIAAVAKSMGAKTILIAGLDGYSENKNNHYYSETDNKETKELLHQQSCQNQILQQLSNKENRNDFNIFVITPTNYSLFYNSSYLNLSMISE